MSAYEGETRKLELPCPVCGGNEFTWGTLNIDRPANFMPPSTGWLRGWMGGIPITSVRHCEICGNIQFGTRDWSKPHPRDVD